jgi:hypothetical protein
LPKSVAFPLVPKQKHIKQSTIWERCRLNMQNTNKPGKHNETGGEGVAVDASKHTSSFKHMTMKLVPT